MLTLHTLWKAVCAALSHTCFKLQFCEQLMVPKFMQSLTPILKAVQVFVDSFLVRQRVVPLMSRLFFYRCQPW